MIDNILVIMQLLFTPMQLTQAEQIKQEIVVELVKDHLDTNKNGILELSEALVIMQTKKSLMDYVNLDLILIIVSAYFGIDLTKRGAIKGFSKFMNRGAKNE